MKKGFVGCARRTTTRLATPYNVDCKFHFGALSAPYTFTSNHVGVSDV
jgi:hypothetical protein